MSSVAYAEWTKVSESENGPTYYIDLERIAKYSGKIYYWELADPIPYPKYGNLSSKIYIEAECGRSRYRWLNRAYYAGPMASGKIVASSDTPDKDWDYPKPNSVSEAALKAACNHKTMQ